MYLVIDIGATKTLIALFSRRGRVVRRAKFLTAQGVKMFFDMLEENLRPFQKYATQSVVIGVPGVVQKDGTARFGNRNWGDVEIRDRIKKLFNCPIYLENDANLAAIYEAYGLDGRTVYLTFSTGIGGGVIEDGKFVVDRFEPGHKEYEYQGKTAEWEDLAAASALGRIYHVDLATEIRGRKAMRDVAARVYLGLPDIASEYRPNTIIIGGPLGKIFRLFSRFLPRIPGVRYRAPKRPQESVIYGGYLYGIERDPTMSEYPEDLLRGTPMAKVFLKRARVAGRRIHRKVRPLVRTAYREIKPATRRIRQKTKSIVWRTERKVGVLANRVQQKSQSAEHRAQHRGQASKSKVQKRTKKTEKK